MCVVARFSFSGVERREKINSIRHRNGLKVPSSAAWGKHHIRRDAQSLMTLNDVPSVGGTVSEDEVQTKMRQSSKRVFPRVTMSLAVLERFNGIQKVI